MAFHLIGNRQRINSYSLIVKMTDGIKSRRVQPQKLLESGFTFRFPDLRGALVHLKTKPEE